MYQFILINGNLRYFINMQLIYFNCIPAMMAIRVLLDHGVEEDDIILVSLLASKPGVCTVAYAYPKVKIIAANLDDDIDDNFHIVPGFGNFGDRFFGTTAIKGTSPK